MKRKSTKWLSTKDAAERLDCSDRKIRYWIRSKFLPATKVGKTYRIHISSIIEIEALEKVRPKPFPCEFERASLTEQPGLLLQSIEIRWKEGTSQDVADKLASTLVQMTSLAAQFSRFFFCKDIASITQRSLSDIPVRNVKRPDLYANQKGVRLRRPTDQI